MAARSVGRVRQDTDLHRTERSASVETLRLKTEHHDRYCSTTVSRAAVNTSCDSDEDGDERTAAAAAAGGGLTSACHQSTTQLSAQ